MIHYSTNLTDSHCLFLDSTLCNKRKRKHSCEILMASSIRLKQVASGVCCQVVFPMGTSLRLSKGFEYKTNTCEAMIQLDVIKLMLNRIHK